jgi:Uma2 family endonuclease
MAGESVTFLTEEQYLRIEREAAYKSEYVGGEMFAMPGGTPRHSMLEAQTVIELGYQLRGKRCRVLSSNMRLRTPISGTQLYPDVSVACGPVQLFPGSTDIMVNPALIVEVLSPSSINYDRGAKFELYREFPSLLDYLIVHQDSIYIEHYNRQPDGSWLLREYKGEQARVPLIGVGCELHLRSIYDRVMEEPV